MSLSEDALHAASEIATTPANALEATVNRHIARFINSPYIVSPGQIVDARGTHTERFSSIIHTDDSTGSSSREIPADRCAAVIDCLETLNAESFRGAHRRIALAKELLKGPVVGNGARTNTTLGIILAPTAALFASQIIDELEKLNAEVPSKLWPDMVVVSTVGVLNYAVQFPGESLSGDYLPPAVGAFATSIPPIYIVPVLKPSGEQSFARMMSFLGVHLRLFAPVHEQPSRAEWLPPGPVAAITGNAYQYDLHGVLRQARRPVYIDDLRRYLPLSIEDGKGNHVATVQYIPWQDGGVVVLGGRFPLEVVLLMGGPALLHGGILKLPSGNQLSNVVPLTLADFGDMLNKLQRQSNLVVRQSQPPLTLQKVADEGTETPIVGRLYVGILRLREITHPRKEDRKSFDDTYEIVLSAVMAAREAARELRQMWARHEESVRSGQVARVQGALIRVDESVDSVLASQCDAFVNAAVRALKTGMQRLAVHLSFDIGFMFQQEKNFSGGLSALQSTDPPLADYLRQARAWTGQLIGLRNRVEHEGWKLPKVKYSQAGSGVVAGEPQVEGVSVTAFVSMVMDRLACLVEDVTAHGLLRMMPIGFTLFETPVAGRNGVAPERFRIILSSGDDRPWQVKYLEVPFEDR